MHFKTFLNALLYYYSCCCYTIFSLLFLKYKEIFLTIFATFTLCIIIIYILSRQFTCKNDEPGLHIILVVTPSMSNITVNPSTRFPSYKYTNVINIYELINWTASKYSKTKQRKIMKFTNYKNFFLDVLLLSHAHCRLPTVYIPYTYTTEYIPWVTDNRSNRNYSALSVSLRIWLLRQFRMRWVRDPVFLHFVLKNVLCSDIYFTWYLPFYSVSPSQEPYVHTVKSLFSLNLTSLQTPLFLGSI
jgi:hypothetical protein